MSQQISEKINDDEYCDKTTHVELDKKVMRQSWLRMLWVQASFNYQRMQSSGFLYAMLPALQRIHKNKHDLSVSLKLHNDFLIPRRGWFLLCKALSWQWKKVSSP